jgi:hypothetical protein
VSVLSDILNLYLAKFEKWDMPDRSALDINHKSKQVEDAIRILAEHSPKLKQLLQSNPQQSRPLKKSVKVGEKRDLAETTTSVLELKSAKKKKMSSNARNFISPYEWKDPGKYVGLRVAKDFFILQTKEHLGTFYGTVSEYLPPEDVEDNVALWEVEYDDGDKESQEKHELIKILLHYDKVKDHDPNSQFARRH